MIRMKFTKSQNEAINHKKGNLKIIACAGSGKTTVMSERIAKLVSEGENRDKIVAFTFTEKAAASLKFNIREALNKRCPQASYLGSMFIGTIHSFALERIKDTMPKYRSYEILDEVKRIIWVAKKYNELGLDDIRITRDRYFDNIQRFMRTTDIIRDNEIPDSDLDVVPEFKEVYERYLALLEKEKYFDFSGIIHKMVEILDTNTFLLRRFHNNVQHLIVDEYHDINHIQERLIALIAGTKGNLCVVGDDDQSIFEFQGAEVSNIINFEYRYYKVHEVKMQENFRCSKEVIEAADNLIVRNQNRISKSMLPGKLNGKEKVSKQGDIYKLEFNRIADEVSYVINKIRELRGCAYEEEEGIRGLDYGDMAIIVRTRRSAQRFIEPFRRERIPFTSRGTGGLFQRPEIDFLRHIFCYFAGQSPDAQSNIVTLNDLRVMFNNLGWTHIRWKELAIGLKALKNEVASITSSNPNPSKRRIFLQEFYYKLMVLLEVTRNNFTQDILYDFGRLSKLIAEFEAVHGWINYYFFGAFVRFINGYAQTRTDEGGLDDPRKTNSVNILTVHQAKGLEFPAVFIPDLSTRRFPSQQRNRLPETHLNNSIFNLRRYCSGDEGERRLFYVAATRTQKFLFITRSRVSDTGSNANRSNYFTEFDHEIMMLNNQPDPTKRKKRTPQCKPNMELLPTSFSDLKYYINCPYSYLLQQMMGFSPVLSPAYGYGLQVHNMLNYLHKKWKKTPPPQEEIEALIESDFFLRFTRGKPFENMKGKAKQILTQYVKDFGKEFPLRLETEKPFELILGGALISGNIDLIQKIDLVSHKVKDVSILDFKTEKERLETKPFIRLQLRLYAMAGDKSLGLNPKSAKIHYLTEGIRQNIDISKEKLDRTQKDITGVIEGIKREQFAACSDDRCKTCDVRFVCHARAG